MNNFEIKKIANLFLIGVLAFLPVVVILQIVIFVKDVINSLFHMVYGYSDNYFYTITVFALSFAVFTYIGYRISEGRFSIMAVIDRVIERIPLLNTVYRITKKVANLITGHEQNNIREVVYIEYPKKGLWVPAYVTNRKDEMYVLFVPTSPNPTSGFTIIVHESNIVKSEMDIEQATSFIVSVGVDFENANEVSKLS